MIAGGAVLAIRGFSGSGRTALLEALVPRLCGRGLRVAVIKHDAHGFRFDTPGQGLGPAVHCRHPSHPKDSYYLARNTDIV